MGQHYAVSSKVELGITFAMGITMKATLNSQCQFVVDRGGRNVNVRHLAKAGHNETRCGKIIGRARSPKKMREGERPCAKARTSVHGRWQHNGKAPHGWLNGEKNVLHFSAQVQLKADVLARAAASVYRISSKSAFCFHKS